MSESINNTVCRHLHNPASHRFFWKCVGAVIAGQYLYSGIKMVILGVFYG